MNTEEGTKYIIETTDGRIKIVCDTSTELSELVNHFEGQNKSYICFKQTNIVVFKSERGNDEKNY